MAQNYYSVEKAAEVLGVTAEEIRAMRDRRELYGYRDGSNWKFKAEDVERLARQRQGGEEEGDVLASDVEGAGGAAPGRVIGADDGAGSDIELAASDSKVKPAARPSPKKQAADDLDLSLEDDLTLDDSTVTKKPAAKKPGGSSGKLVKKPGASGGKLAKKPGDSGKDVVGDEDLVLGGSGSGSDITIGGDSGIQLVDPADSGLSLEEPLDLTAPGEESLELGEDDMISLSEDAGTDAVTKVKADDDFLLAPAQETTEDEDESGSQVIALDAEPSSDQAATMVGTASKASMVALLDEDLTTAAGASAPGFESPMMAAPMPAVPAPEPVVIEAALPETPYSLLSVLSLATCVMLLVLGGIMVFDLGRNMWSWDSPYQFNSSVMDTVLGLFEG